VVNPADERISHWAKTENPLFGSRPAARDASDRFRFLSSSTAWATFLIAEKSGDGPWFAEKGGDFAGNMGGLAAARNITGVLKPAVHRERPHNGPVHDSFPSAHSTDAFAHASMGRHYADGLPGGDAWQTSANVALNTFAAATAWGRVEGGVHYPSDVLAGAAIANFFTRFIIDLAGSDGIRGWRVSPRTREDGTVIIDFEKPL
jgi:membrane-associated phospholipid phosphatase